MTLREGDIEAISRKLDDRGRPKEGRSIIDKQGNRIYYNSGKDGKVTVTHREEDHK